MNLRQLVYCDTPSDVFVYDQSPAGKRKKMGTTITLAFINGTEDSTVQYGTVQYLTASN